MKRILITGSSGFTGRALIESLQNTGWDVIPMDRQAAGIKGEVIIDFCDEGFYNALQTLPPVDAVVHLGTRVGWNGGTRVDLFKPNVLATAQLVEWAMKNNSYFVFASAALIYGVKSSIISNPDGINTSNDYLYSKWLAEEIIKMSGIRHAILRISGIFGMNGPFHLGINKAIAGALKGIPPAQHGDGRIKRNYVYVHDLCNIIKYCVENRDRIGGSFLIASSHVNSVAEMLAIICEKLLPGKKPEIWPGTGEDHDQIVDPSPGFPETRSFNDAIADIAQTAL